jgi:hypothetical protein
MGYLILKFSQPTGTLKPNAEPANKTAARQLWWNSPNNWFVKAKPFPTNQKFGLTGLKLPIHIAKESSVRYWGYRDDVAQPAQLKRMELPTHPLKNELTFAAV